MKYVISGASAVMGRQVADLLLQNVASSQLTLMSRNPASLQAYSDKGVAVVAGHHGDAESLKAGYADADVVFCISSLSVGERVPHHRDVIDIAKASGVKHLVYTSVAGAHPENPTPSAKEHWATEKMLWDSGMNFTALRNQCYSELFYTMVLEQGLSGRPWMHNSDQGGFAPVARTDISACVAAIMLAPEKHQRVVYEITGCERFTFPSLVALAEKVTGQSIDFRKVSDEEMYKIYESLGVPRHGDTSQTFIPLLFGSDELVQQFRAYEMHMLDVQTNNVELITGKKARTVQDVFEEIHATGG
jgi:NAD(P)H dehydrogenase (quinone)